jgi:hypothetical protein
VPLTPEGWKKAPRIFGRSNPYRDDGEVFLTSRAGLIGETWLRGDRAEVERKWSDVFGSIDSDLRYKPADPTSSTLPVPSRKDSLTGSRHERTLYVR